MNASSEKALEDVFKKWEKKGEERRLNAPGSSAGHTAGIINADVKRGRDAWLQRFDPSALPRRRTNRNKHHQAREIDSNEHFNLAQKIERKFQLIPPTVEDLHRSSRPFLSTGCSKCTKKSKVMFTSDKIKSSPLRNLLDLSVFSRKNFFRAAFSDILFVAKLPRENNKIANIRTKVVASPGVSSTIQRLATSQVNGAESHDLKAAEELEKPPLTSKQLKQEAKKIVNTMHGILKGYFVKIATWILFKFFGRILSSIQVHQGQIAMLHEASRKNTPLVYLPLHKSHADYVLISFVLSWYRLKVPYITIEDNLRDIPFFGWLTRNVGGYFVQRKRDQLTPQNELYRAVMNEYIAQILLSGNSLEIVIEGTMSRADKSYPPNIGALSSVISAVTEGRVSDVLIVPVNISYEKVLKTGNTDELLDEPKSPESFFQIVKNVWRIFRCHFGQVRVDFGLPFSLMEMKHASESIESWQNLTKNLSTNQMSTRDTASEMSLESLDSSATALKKGIVSHVIYDCVQNSTIMGTNMVAFLLLTKFRKGVELKEFANAFELLKKDILMRKRDYGFSGANEDVILHSIKLLGKDLVSWNEESCIIKPILSLPGLLGLSYYSKQVLSVFVLESVIACSIGALLADENKSLSELIYQNTTIARRKVLNAALDLCDLLHREFIFSPPCVSLETALIDAIDMFIASDVLNVCEDISMKSREKQWANRLAISTSWSDDEESDEEPEIADQEYKINSTDESIRKLKFLRIILSPIVESYWFVASSLLTLPDNQCNEKDFIILVHKAAISRGEAGTALFNESCSLVTITNAVKRFQEYGILDSIQKTKTSTNQLSVNSNDYKKDIHHLMVQINR